MDHSAVWKVLEKIIMDFKKREVNIKEDLISELRHTKTLINILKADPFNIDLSGQVKENLRNLESQLITEGETRFGNKYTKKWLKQLDEANRSVIEKQESKTTFIPGIPRNKKWIRIKPSSELKLEKLKALAVESKLKFKLQNNYFLVYGEDESTKTFIKKIAREFGFKAKK
jgi:hypothetical protein